MNDAAALGRLLIIAGLVVVVVGAIIMVAGRLPRLPGDIVIRRDTFTLYIPVVTSLVISIVLTLILNLLAGRR